MQYGGIWNIDTQDIGNHKALGLHYELSYKNWNVKSQFVTYKNQPKNAQGQSIDIIEMTAYGSPYNTAAKANLYSIGLAYTLKLNKGIFKTLQFYNDYSYMDKTVKTWEDSQMNVLGMLLSAKPAYIYLDYGLGLNHPWLGSQYTDAFTTGDPANGWEGRFNINMGFYF